MSRHRAHPVAADSVHVWRGFKSPSITYDAFAQFLGSVFVPACSLLQPNAGLCAYVPSMTHQTNKPASVPDQTALMFWADQNAYTNAFKTPAVRAYTNLHGDAYDTTRSKSGFPIPLGTTITPDQPYHLLNGEADWMLGHVHHLVGARNTNQTPADFLAAIQTWAAAYRDHPAEDVDGALLSANDDYVVFWEHGTNGSPSAALNDLASQVTPFLNKTAANVAPGGGLWDDWPGWDLTKNDCMSVQLDRPKHEKSA